MTALVLDHVGKQWETARALEDVSLQVESGSFCVLLGPSGCGKSTTLRIIAGLEQPTTGRVMIDGRDVTDLPPAERGLAMVFQNYALFPHLTVADNITFGLQVRRVAADERAARLQETAELLGLSDLLKRRPSQLSGGQRQRVALGRALVAGSRMCLMDEPLSNLDAKLRQEMRRELRDLQRKLELTVIYVTHDQAEAMSMADQVVLLNEGRIEQAASPREIYARPATTFVARFIGTPPMNLLAIRDGRVDGSPVAVDLPAGAAWLGVRPEEIEPRPVDEKDVLPAIVRGTEYLGADAILECKVGGQPLLVRIGGDIHLEPGTPVGLAWPARHTHAFDPRGRHLPSFL